MNASRDVDLEPRFDRGHALEQLRVWSSARSIAVITTPTTSPDLHGRRELSGFGIVTTLNYASTEQRDEYPVYASLPTLEETALWAWAHQLSADIVFVDPWHTYEDSAIAIRLGIDIVAERGGYVLVHDCDPPTEDLARAPDERWKLAWCGQTWRAFLDIASSLPSDHDWMVIDADYGVGVIEVPAAGPFVQRPGRWRQRWPRAERDPVVPMVPAHFNDDESWDWLGVNRAAVMRLTSPADFCARFTRAAKPG